MSAFAERLQRRSATHTRWAAALTVLACVIGVLAPAPPLGQQVLIVGLAVALLGFPHGALDPLVAALREGGAAPHALPRFLLLYVAAAAAVVLLWLASPPAGLVLFLVTSAIHFGLGDVPRGTASPAPGWSLRVAAHGSAPILLPAAFHPAGVGVVFGWLLGLPGESVTDWLVDARLPLVAAWFTLAIAGYLRRGAARAGALELGLLAAAFAVLPPLLSFAVYFCAWHSARHLLTVDAVLGRDLRARALVVGLAVLAATAILVAVAHASGSDPGSMESAARSMFVALAALTPPHMMVTAVLARRVVSLRAN